MVRQRRLFKGGRFQKGLNEWPRVERKKKKKPEQTFSALKEEARLWKGFFAW